MTCRLPSVCLMAAALLTLPGVTSRTLAKPPDLPILEKNTLAPWLQDVPLNPAAGCLVLPPENGAFLAQMPLSQMLGDHVFKGAGQECTDVKVQVQEAPAGGLLFGVGVNSDGGIAGSVIQAAPMPYTKRVAIPAPGLARLRPSVRRNLVASLLFVVHPLMVLTPTDQFLDMPSDHPQPMVAGDTDTPESALQPCDQSREELFKALGWGVDDTVLAPPGTAGTFVTAASMREARRRFETILWKWMLNQASRHQSCDLPMHSDIGLCGTIGLNERNFDVSCPSACCPKDAPKPAACTPAPGGSECPYVRQHAKNHLSGTSVQPEMPTVLDNLRSLRQAEHLLKKGEKLVRAGRAREALECFEKARQLCPGSSVERRAEQAVEEMFAHLFEESMKKDADAAEEQQAPPDEDKPTPQHTLEKRLNQPITANFTDAPLRQILDDLRTWMGVNIFVDMPALEEEGVNLDTPISIKLETVSLKSTLNIVLKQVHLTYVVKDNVILVTTEKHAGGKLMLTTYPVADLVKDVKLRAMLAMGKETTWKDSRTNAAALVEFITSAVAPRSWAERGGQGTAEYFPLAKVLVVLQTPNHQEAVAEMLENLRLLSAELKIDRQHEGRCTRTCEPGIEVQVNSLMRGCHVALEVGRHRRAAQLAREAFALDPERVKADPVVYKMHLLGNKKEVCDTAECPASTCCEGCPHCPMQCPAARGLQPPLPPVDHQVVSALEQVLADSHKDDSKRSGQIEEKSVARPVNEKVVLGSPGAEEQEAASTDKKVRKEVRLGRFLDALLGEWNSGSPMGGSIEIGTDFLGLRVLCDIPCGGSMYHVLYNRGAWAVWMTPDPETSKTEEKPR